VGRPRSSRAGVRRGAIGAVPPWPGEAKRGSPRHHRGWAGPRRQCEEPGGARPAGETPVGPGRVGHGRAGSGGAVRGAAGAGRGEAGAREAVRGALVAATAHVEAMREREAGERKG
jgi:hypothetical protein